MHPRGKANSMTESEMWKAVIENDEKYDRVFLYAVKTTGIYCRPSCKSKIPNIKNVIFFKDGNSAQQAGFRPCKRCRSDLLSYNHTKETAQKVKNLIDDFYSSSHGLNREIQELGLSRQQIVEIFKQEYGLTPKNYIDLLRIEKTKKLLTQTTDEIIDIAYSVGFNSISTFYRFFKKYTSKSPGAYREETHNDKNSFL